MKTVRDVLAALDAPSKIQSFVLKHGRLFQPIPRPAGMRKRKAELWFASAGSMPLDGLALSYVEGFAMGIGESRFIHHAWLTPDGATAIDPVADDATQWTYFGIPFSTRALAEIVGRRSIHGLLDPVDITVTRAMILHPYNA